MPFVRSSQPVPRSQTVSRESAPSKRHKSTPKKKPVLNILEQKTQFFTWLKTLKASDYPLQAAVIKRVQKHHRPALIEDAVELWILYNELRVKLKKSL
jgi:hypothetical protein